MHDNDCCPPGLMRLWHRAYCRWFASVTAGHRTRARIWGWVADHLIALA